MSLSLINLCVSFLLCNRLLENVEAKMNGEGEDASKVIHVKLITKLDSPFKVPVTSVVIPSSVTRLGLSLSLSLPVSLVSVHFSLALYLVDFLELSVSIARLYL